MIITWGLFIFSILMILIWLTEFIPSFEEKGHKAAIKNILIWAIAALASAQCIWG